MPAVWIWIADYPVKYSMDQQEAVNKLGPGIKKKAKLSVAANREDGTGSSSSYHGANIFQATYPRMNHAGAGDADDMLDFIRARDNDGASFYWYDPGLRVPDPTGTDTTGRYLVTVLAWEKVLYAGSLYGFTVTFEEDLS